MTDGQKWDTIPGETPIDPSGLKIRGVKTRDELDIVEASNIRKATMRYLGGSVTAKMAPFDYSWALRLHKEMFGDVWDWAGRQRSKELNIGCQAFQIAEQLAQLLGDLKSWAGCEMPILEQAARLHHRAVAIHPFENGNGRWSRLMANIWLHLSQAPLIDWPNQTIGKKASEIRMEYLATLKEADQGNFEPLLAIQNRFVLPE
jgi:Fic-DOC domain mobile mystery protein B